MNEMQFPLTKRLTSIWIAAVIVLVAGTIGTATIQRLIAAKRIDAIHADIRAIDAAATQLANR